MTAALLVGLVVGFVLGSERPEPGVPGGEPVEIPLVKRADGTFITMSQAYRELEQSQERQREAYRILRNDYRGALAENEALREQTTLAPPDNALDIRATLRQALEEVRLAGEHSDRIYLSQNWVGLVASVDASSVPTLVEIAQDQGEDMEVRGNALGLLRAVGGEAAALALGRLLASASTPEALRVTAARNLGGRWNASNPTMEAALLPALGDDEAAVRTEAAEALRRLATPRVTRALIQMARQDPDPGARISAVQSLEQNGGPEELGVIEDMATQDPDPGVRRAAEHSAQELRSRLK